MDYLINYVFEQTNKLGYDGLDVLILKMERYKLEEEDFFSKAYINRHAANPNSNSNSPCRYLMPSHLFSPQVQSSSPVPVPSISHPILVKERNASVNHPWYQ